MQENDVNIGLFLEKAVIKNYATLNKLHYGNLDREQEKYLSQKNIFSSKKKHFISNTYPKIADTYSEINKLIKIGKKTADNPVWRKNNLLFVKACDDAIHKVFAKEFNKMGISYDADELEETQEELGALVMQLKMKFNRPRPNQFAYYTHQKLFPIPTLSGHSPAYTSGHACQSYFLMEIMAHKNPSKATQLRKLAKRIADTRIVMGVHYESDNAFGKEIAMELVKMPDIRKIYFK